MKILILNRGSSSIKCCVFDWDHLPEYFVQPIWSAHLTWKNDFKCAILSIKKAEEKEVVQDITRTSSNAALKQLLNALWKGKTAILNSLNEIDLIGHRIVHGGKYFDASVCIDPAVKEKIKCLANLAPLHNAADLEGIELIESLFKTKPQIAVFDTAFHHCLPKQAAIYPGPYTWYEEDIYRYGFHGISFQYCSLRASQMLAKKSSKMLICHLGSGASLCAIKEGKSIDTTMGFTPLEGLMMDTRCGSIDPGILLYLLKKKKTLKELEKELYHASGLLGLSGFSSDMRDIIEKSALGDFRSTLAFDVYLHRLIAQIGSMIASLQGLDVLVFTAGIGENASLVRKRVCDAFSFLGCKLDENKNLSTQMQDCDLSASGSSCKILLIHTQEAFEIARESWRAFH